MNLLSATTLRTPRRLVKSRRINFWRYSTPSVTTCHLPYILLCKTQRRRLILSYISCLFFSLAVLRSITGCCVSHIEKVARSDGGVEKHHLNQSVYIRYLTPSPYTPPISSAMSRGRVEFILLRGVFVAQKYRGDTEKTIVSEERVWNIQGQSPLIID